MGDMQLNKRASKYQGYHTRDAQLAIQLIADSKNIPQKDMAALCHMSDTTFSHHLRGIIKISQVNAYSKEHFGHTGKHQMKTPYSLEERQMKILAEYLGKKCGYETGFAGIDVMIAYAQEHCKAQLAAKLIAEDKEMTLQEIAKLRMDEGNLKALAENLGKKCGYPKRLCQVSMP